MAGFQLLRESLAWGGMSDSKGSGSWLTQGLGASPGWVPPGWTWCPVDPCKALMLCEAEAAKCDKDFEAAPGVRH